MAQAVLKTEGLVVLTVRTTSHQARLPDGLRQLSVKSHGSKLMAKLGQELRPSDARVTVFSQNLCVTFTSNPPTPSFLPKHTFFPPW